MKTNIIMVLALFCFGVSAFAQVANETPETKCNKAAWNAAISAEYEIAGLQDVNPGNLYVVGSVAPIPLIKYNVTLNDGSQWTILTLYSASTTICSVPVRPGCFDGPFCRRSN